MITHVIQEASAPTGDDNPKTKMTHLVDCYCGSGLLAIAGASHGGFDTAIGIEVNSEAVKEAAANAELNGISNAKFLAASAENIFSEIKDYPRESTVVIMDPPRKGASEEFLEQLLLFRPKKIVYLSCDISTQARDAKILCGSETSRYVLGSIQPIDLFPQTRHIECCAVFHLQEE
jgi:tRNA (uracil-5-)-methyltransferase